MIGLHGAGFVVRIGVGNFSACFTRKNLNLSLCSSSDGRKNGRGSKPEAVKIVDSETNRCRITEEDLGPPPDKPLPGDCCGSGCERCVWDIYFEELEDYNKRKKDLQDSSKSS